jgi:iron complex transport system ATP-binding protein
VLVTHHVEEIVAEFTHLLALRRGRVVYGGPKSQGLTARILTAIFGVRLAVRKSASRYLLRSLPKSGKSKAFMGPARSEN